MPMIISKLDTYVNGEPIWKYEREEGTYYVRDRGKLQNGTNHFVIKNPSNDLYTFYDYEGTIEDAINVIREKKAEGSEFFCGLDSIYE